RNDWADDGGHGAMSLESDGKATMSYASIAQHPGLPPALEIVLPTGRFDNAQCTAPKVRHSVAQGALRSTLGYRMRPLGGRKAGQKQDSLFSWCKQTAGFS